LDCKVGSFLGFISKFVVGSNKDLDRIYI
jgi:hypothetical protein